MGRWSWIWHGGYSNPRLKEFAKRGPANHIKANTTQVRPSHLMTSLFRRNEGCWIARRGGQPWRMKNGGWEA